MDHHAIVGTEDETIKSIILKDLNNWYSYLVAERCFHAANVLVKQIILQDSDLR